MKPAIFLDHRTNLGSYIKRERQRSLEARCCWNGRIAVAISSFSEDHSIAISALQNERDWLKELVRAELDAVRRGEGSMQAADDLSQRLNHVESRIVRFLMDFLSVA